MTFLEAAPLKLGLWPIKWLFTVVFAPFGTREMIRPGKNFVNIFRVGSPVSRNIQRAAGGQSVGDQIQKIRLHDTTFVVPFFRPGVWKVKIYSRQ